MVLEAVIVEILNKFLGEYVESVDRSQLKVAFGGDVALDDLILKQNALDELNLPVKTVYGRLGKLKLSIPWTNLYKAPWVVQIERVFLLSVPLGEIKYDAEREEKQEQEAKQKELLKVEEAKRQEAERGKDVKHDASFVENLVAHIIKNLQVTFKDIHIRYEDQVTHLGSPFALGVTLSQLRMQSTDEKGKPANAQQTISLFHKTLILEGLALYWNANSQLYSKVDDLTKLQRFLTDVATKESQPPNYTYMFGPISASAQLQMNPKPEVDDFKIPKFKLDMNMDVLSIGITKMQYRDLVKLLESMDQMARGAPYRKYRPNLDKYRGYYAIWWHFAYQCILESEVRRRRNNYNWERIKRHRAMCHKYEATYKAKLESKKPSAEVLKILEELERKLDVFNLVIMRQRAELQVQKSRKLEEESKKKAGWFSGWWGGGQTQKAPASGTAADLANKLEAAMNAEEKAKLYQAIGYQENAAPAQFPPDFVAIYGSFVLGKLLIKVQDEDVPGKILLQLELANVTSKIQQRPSALANRVEVRLQRLTVVGCEQDGQKSVLARSLETSGSASLLDVLFETNPEDRSCDQRVRISAQPLELAYDAKTVNHVIDMFNPPEKPSLNQLQAMAVSKIEEIREVSATLLQHAIQQQKVLELNANFAASTLLLPQGGKMIMCSDDQCAVPVLVVSLGSLSVSSKPRDSNRPSISHMLNLGSTEQEVLQEMIAQSYDRFSLSLSDMQVLVANSQEDWKSKLTTPQDSALHLVQPTNIDIKLHRSLLPNDPRIPQFKVEGQLPALSLSLAEDRLLLMAGIFASVPWPKSDEPEQPNLQDSRSISSSMIALQQLGKIDRRHEKTQALDLVVGSVKLELSFEMKELRVLVLRGSECMLDFSLLSLELDVTQRPFDMTVHLRLGGICMKQAVSGQQTRIISTPMADGKSVYLFVTKLVLVDRKSPEFHIKHESVEKLLEVCFTSLDILLHQSAILDLMRFSSELQEKVNALHTPAPRDRSASTRPAMDRLISVIPEEGGPITKSTTRQRKSTKLIIELRLIARLDKLCIQIASPSRLLTCFSLQGVQAKMTMMPGQQHIETLLTTMEVLDLNPSTLYKKIIESEEGEALSAKIIMYDNPTERQPQMSVTANMAKLRIMFLNIYVNSLLGFINNFQTAVNAVKEASAAAAEAAKQNMQQVYENATKIALNIHIKAPIVCVPRSTRNSEAFLLDFGEITLKNKFIEMEASGERNMTLDVLSLALRQMQLTRVLLDEQNRVMSQNFLIRPFDFMMDVERNLSIGWCKQKPGVNLSSNLAPIKIDLHREDITLGLLVQAENLGDVEETALTTPPVLEVEGPVAPPRRPTSLKGVSRQFTEVSQGVEAEESANITAFKQMAFSFHMTSIEFNLLLPVSSPVKSEEIHGLAHFTLENLKVTGEMKSDESMAVHMLLENCLLRDMRRLKDINTPRILDLMSVKKRKTGTKTTQNVHTPMINVEFEKVPPHTKLTATVSGFDLVLCLDYLLKVSDFFVSAMPETTKPPPQVVQSKPKTSGNTRNSAVRQLSTSATAGEFALLVLLEKPDIILVESMADINTKAIIFSVEGNCKIRMTPERQTINMEIKNIQLYSCCFNPERRIETLSQVLRPCTLSVAGGTNVGQQPSLSVDLSAVRVTVSPITINILANCLSALGSGQNQQDYSDEGTKILPDYSLLWRPESFKENKYWFLTDIQDAVELLEDDNQTVGSEGGLIIFSANSFEVTVEAGTGIKSQPLMLMESSLQASVSNWTTNLDIQGDLSLQVSCYNSRLALWEPLLEPVEIVRNDTITHIPWQLNFTMKMNPQTTPIISPSDVEGVASQKPKTCVSFHSSKNVEVTISRCTLDIFSTLTKAFQLAVKDGRLSSHLEESPPYIVQNNTGLRVFLLLDETNFQVDTASGGTQTVDQVVLESGAQIGLVLQEPSVLSPVKRGGSILQEQVHEYLLPVKITDKNCVIKVPLARAEKRFFLLGTKPNEGVVSEVRLEAGSRCLTLRSIIQVHNQFSLPVDVYYMTPRGNEVECVGVVAPGQFLDLPLHAVYSPTSEIFFSLPGHTVCITPFKWKDLLTTVSISKTIKCEPKEKDAKDPYFMKAVAVMEQIFFEGTSIYTMASCVFNVSLRPTVVLRNLLPVPLICESGRGKEEIIAPGAHLHLASVEPGTGSITLRLDNYLEKVWSCKREVQGAPELAVWSFDSWDSSARMSLDLGMHTITLQDTLYMSLYAPFWMINKTGLFLSYRKSRRTEKNESSGSPLKRWASTLTLGSGSPTSNVYAQSEESTNVLYHPPNFEGPILFSFRPKNFFGKKKACVKIEDSDWSNKFSLDVAGSSGSVICKANNQQYQIGVSIHLAESNLTKLVTLTPYFLLVNHAPYHIQCQEGDRPADPWTLVESKECAPLWPQGLSNRDHTLRLRVQGTTEMTAPFSFNQNHTTLLKLHNKYGGINIDVQVSEGAIYINMSEYQPGLAPALIINHTNCTIEFWEKSTSRSVKKLAPMEQALYTWENPTGSRLLVWNSLTSSGKKDETCDMLRKDGLGRMWLSSGQKDVYWVSFLNGMQRVLLFTANPEVARDAQAAADLEPVDMEVSVSLHGLGLSLVSQEDKRMVELLYMAIASSGIAWESKKPNKNKWEALNSTDCILLEEAYQRGLSTAILSDGIVADLILNQVQRRQLRRNYQPGVWLQLCSSRHQQQMHAKLHTLQVDCQMPDCVFPIVLAPVPPPKSVAADKGPRPYVEVSVVKRLLVNSTVQQFRYLRMLVQEFHVKLDMGFINSLYDLFVTEESMEIDHTEKVASDLHIVEQPLKALVAVQSAQEQKNFYDQLHLSPLKIHLSFSMSTSGAGLSKSGSARLNVLNALMQNVGVTLTDLQDVVFKLGYFEREASFLTQRQLTQEIVTHYTQQGVKQLYVLVLGLDVIGNPFGLVLGLKQGVEDLFYEPFQGAIQGPGEFAEGLRNGVRSLLGHTLSGTAAAMSRITGTVGKTLANLSFDEEYQRRRREQQMNRPTALHEGLVQSGKGLVTGVMSGVTGVITKPISGAQNEGVGGFFKGIGAGMIGLVTQPTGGVIDFASNTLDTVKRAADTADEVKPLRFPRYISSGGHITPYSHAEAFGNHLHKIVDKGRFAKTDNYLYHAAIGGRKEVVLLTDKRIMLVSRNDLFGQWQCEWHYPWSTMRQVPALTANGLQIYTGDQQKKVMGLFKTSEAVKTLIITDQSEKQKIYELVCKIINEKLSVPNSPPR